MDLIYISGPPGVGKLTVATALAERTGYRLFHNHLSIGAIEPVFEFDSEPFWRLVHELRERVFETAAQEGVDLIFTNVYRHPDDFERAYRRLDVAERHGGRVCPVFLTCDQETLEGRLISPSRETLHKLRDVEILRAVLATPGVYRAIPGREGLTIDNTHLSPDDAASRIIRHYGLQERDTR